jgi:aryl-alcohol dehydrogenase-like predicted oxidoreductase
MRYKIFSQRTRLKVSELGARHGYVRSGLGLWCDPEEVRRIIAGFANAGGNFIDTADNY